MKRRIQNSHPRKRWEDTARTRYLTPATLGLWGLAGISRYRKQCEGDTWQYWQSGAMMHSSSPRKSSTNCWKENPSKGCCGAEQMQVPCFHRRTKCHELTMPDIKRTLCLFETTAWMTFHLPSFNPLIITAAAAEDQSLHLFCISGCHGKKKKMPAFILCRQKGNTPISAWGNWRPVSQKTLKANDSSSQLFDVLALRATWKNRLRFIALNVPTMFTDI